MIYLFSQIAVSLVLAAIVGCALGWLAHRARAGKQIDQLSSLVTRQQQQVSEAQTQVSLLTDDFDDLKHQSEAEIAALKLENQKIPALNQNLEKSQLLVRQLMQQHKAESAEIMAENEMLTAKAKLINDREQAITKLQAELDIERRRTQQLRGESTETVAESTETESVSKAESQRELPLIDQANNNSDAVNQKTIDDKQIQDTNVGAANSDADLTDKQTNTISAVVATTAAASTTNLSQAANSESASAAETEAELKLLRDQLAADIPSKNPTITEPTKSQVYSLEETTVDEQQLEPLFDSVAQHDDLKQIFGIGPVTEKTLNKLGITAYSQLAELKRHDIEKIADALQIFPGRIERDNWVGGARAQLEEVLEDL